MLVLRQIANNIRTVPFGFRAVSSSNRLVDVGVDNDGIATVTMQKPPVNSLSLEMLHSLSDALDEVDKSKCKGMILTSSSPTVFSAGLDLMELYKPNIKRAEAFFKAFQEVWVKLFGSNFITAAAINGHAPAGGCILAMSCEYRVMVSGNYTTGLNEVLLGLVVNDWLVKAMSAIISKRQTELALTTGAMFTADEALKVGLIDEAATDKADAINKCRQFINKFDNVHPIARAMAKKKMREPLLTHVLNNSSQNLQESLKNITNPEIQQSLEVNIQNMKQRNAAKKTRQ